MIWLASIMHPGLRYYGMDLFACLVTSGVAFYLVFFFFFFFFFISSSIGIRCPILFYLCLYFGFCFASGMSNRSLRLCLWLIDWLMWWTWHDNDVRLLFCDFLLPWVKPGILSSAGVSETWLSVFDADRLLCLLYYPLCVASIVDNIFRYILGPQSFHSLNIFHLSKHIS